MFHVPAKHMGLYSEVERGFRLLLAKNVVTGITEMQLDKWLSNFFTEIDQYLAARLLESLTFRSEAMVGSAIGHVLQCILPCELRKLGISTFLSIDNFVDSLVSGDKEHPVRFVEIDDPKGRQPGKSGAVIIRELHRLGGVSNRLMYSAQNMDNLPDTVRCLVFVDDMLGTGTQFKSFAKQYKLEQHAARRGLVYCPLAAYSTGLKALSRDCPWLKVVPVEEFGEQHRFFRADADNPEIWAVDRTNTVEGVRQHVKDLCDRGGIAPSGKFDLELLIGFHHATPNNTLKLMYTDSPTWHHLLTR